MPYSGKAPSQWHFLETSCCRNLFSVSIRKALAVLVEPVEVLPEVSSDTAVGELQPRTESQVLARATGASPCRGTAVSAPPCLK